MSTATIEVQIYRSVSTGKYHRGFSGSNITLCNASGQRKIPRILPASDAEVAKASDHMFCGKCFPHGKAAS